MAVEYLRQSHPFPGYVLLLLSIVFNTLELLIQFRAQQRFVSANAGCHYSVYALFKMQVMDVNAMRIARNS